MGDPVLGKTRWRRFGLAFLPGVSSIALMLWLIASGVIAIQLSISGIPFVLKATSLSGTGFVQYAEPDQVAQHLPPGMINPFIDNAVIQNSANIGPEAQATNSTQWYAADTVTRFANANIDGLVQYVCLGPLNVFQIAPLNQSLLVVTEGNASATNLAAYAPGLVANNAVFNNMFIGQAFGPSSTFSQQADNATISDVTQVGLATTAGTFTVNGLKVYAAFVDACPVPGA